MNWFTLYTKTGKQNLGKMKKTEVIAIINGREIPLVIQFKTDGSPLSHS